MILGQGKLMVVCHRLSSDENDVIRMEGTVESTFGTTKFITSSSPGRFDYNVVSKMKSSIKDTKLYGRIALVF